MWFIVLARKHTQNGRWHSSEGLPAFYVEASDISEASTRAKQVLALSPGVTYSFQLSDVPNRSEYLDTKHGSED